MEEDLVASAIKLHRLARRHDRLEKQHAARTTLKMAYNFELAEAQLNHQRAREVFAYNLRDYITDVIKEREADGRN